MALPKNDVFSAEAVPLYERDFHKWLIEQARALREGKLTALDAENLAEEIEDMGRSEKRAVLSQLARLITHLLKWSVQKDLRRRNKRSENSWRGSIGGARLELSDLLADSPSLRRRLPELLPRAYVLATRWAIGETGLPESAFPDRCPWTIQQVMREDFYSDDAENGIRKS
jgi:hypothetical protein